MLQIKYILFEAFCEDIKLDNPNFDERYGMFFYEAVENLRPQFSSGNIDSRKVFETCYMFCDELFLEPTMSYFGA